MRITQQDNMTIIWFVEDKEVLVTELKQFDSENGYVVTIGINDNKIAYIFIDVE